MMRPECQVIIIWLGRGDLWSMLLSAIPSLDALVTIILSFVISLGLWQATTLFLIKVTF